jgi:peptidoglycan/xylan/chitin deacetylase (PgdA/CDA1 family)
MMIRRLLHTIRKSYEPKALVLMYHRVADLETDVWRLAVKPQNFEEHLQVLSRNWHVVPLAELAEDLALHRLRRNSTAITFDDGYEDNYVAARPLLEKYSLPATFFICSANIGRRAEFWWDELEQIILSTQELPQTLNKRINQAQLSFDLGEERYLTEVLRRKHQQWKAFVQEPPTLRSALYLKLWEQLKPLPSHLQQAYLQQLKVWAGVSGTPRAAYQSMNLEQLKSLARNRLFDLGAHTASHYDLARLSLSAQRQELASCKSFLEKATDREVTLLAYPYGSYNQDTVMLAAEAGFEAAVTTQDCPVIPTSAKYKLGRFLVDDWSGKQLDASLKSWLTTKANAHAHCPA